MSEELLAKSAAQPKSERILTPDPGWFHFNFGEVWEAREIAFRFVHRDLTSSFKQTVLGPLWLILPPIFTALTFTLLGQIAAIPTNGAPPFLFYMMGSVLWSYFSSCVVKTSSTFLGAGGIFGKVYFARLTVPLAAIFFNLTQLLIQILLFAAFYLFYVCKGMPLRINEAVFFLPFMVLQLGMFGMGIGCFFSSLTVKYRDLNMMLTFGMQLWMYGSCVLYPLSSIQDKWPKLGWIFALNPIVPVLEFVRYACFGAGVFQPGYLLLSAAVSVFTLFVGLTAFKRMEATFMDTV